MNVVLAFVVGISVGLYIGARVTGHVVGMALKRLREEGVIQ